MAKQGTGRSASVKRSAKRAAVKQAPIGKDFVPITCSECFSELMLDPNAGSDAIECPVCGHAAGFPDGANLHMVAEKRRQEQSSLTVGLAATGVAVVSFLYWSGVAQTPAGTAEDAGMAFYGPLGLAFIAMLVMAIFIFKHEGNRWEVYF